MADLVSDSIAEAAGEGARVSADTLLVLESRDKIVNQYTISHYLADY